MLQNIKIGCHASSEVENKKRECPLVVKVLWICNWIDMVLLYLLCCGRKSEVR